MSSKYIRKTFNQTEKPQSTVPLDLTRILLHGITTKELDLQFINLRLRFVNRVRLTSRAFAQRASSSHPPLGTTFINTIKIKNCKKLHTKNIIEIRKIRVRTREAEGELGYDGARNSEANKERPVATEFSPEEHWPWIEFSHFGVCFLV